MSKIKVHTILMGDVEDPDLFVAQPIWEWQQSEKGKWVMANAIEPPCWYRNGHNYGWRYDIVAEFEPKNQTYWWLKWGHELDNDIKYNI